MNTSTHTVVCPHCQAKLRTAALSEKQVRCPKCRVPFRPTTTAPAAPAAKIVCSSCQTKVKGVKPGAKFKCPKCGSIERAAPLAKQPGTPADAEQTKAPSPKPMKPEFTKKPAPRPMKPISEAETKTIPDATDDEIESPAEPKWKSEQMPVAPPKPTPPKPSTATSSNRSRRRDDDDDEESSWRISGKLLTTLVVLVLIGAIAGAWSYFGSDSGPARGAITGEVTLDGVPVAVGTILFKSLDAKGINLAVPDAPIENGKYKIAREQGPAAGMCKVEIRVKIKSGRKKIFMGVAEDEFIEGAAERFHSKSELTFDVKAGANTKDFSVSSK